MNTATDRNEIIAILAGVSLVGKSDEFIIKEVQKRAAKATDTATQIAVLAYVLIEQRGFKTTEAAAALDYSTGTISAYSNKGKALVTAKITETVAVRTLWAQLGSLTAERITSISADMVSADNPAELVEIASMTAIISSRLGDQSTPEKVEAIRTNLVAQGITLPARVRTAVATTAQALDITLPVVTRDKAAAGAADSKAEEAPTTARASKALEQFENDRLAGSEGAEFELSAQEVRELVAIAQTAIRQLFRAGAIEAIVTITETLEEATVTA